MLGKLIKHSFKSTAKSVYIIYIIMAVIGLVMLITNGISFSSSDNPMMEVIIRAVFAVLFNLAAFTGLIMTIVAVTNEFSKNLYSDQGYLTMSLPTRGSSLLFAKWLSGTAWAVISYALLMLSLYFSANFMINGLGGVMGEDMTKMEIIQALYDNIRDAMGLSVGSLGVVLNVVILYMVQGAIYLSVFLMVIFFALTLAHCRPFAKLGKFGVLLYVVGGILALNIVNAIVSRLICIYIAVSDTYFSFVMSENKIKMLTSDGLGFININGAYCMILGAVVLFIITSNLIEDRINEN